MSEPDPRVASRDKAFRTVGWVVRALQRISVILVLSLLLLVGYTILLVLSLVFEKPFVPAG